MSDERRILYLTHRPDLERGGQRSLAGLLKGLDRTRFAPELAVPEEGPFAAWARERGIPAHTPGPWPHIVRTAPWVTAAFLVRLGKLLRDRRPRIVHVDVPRLAHLVRLAGWRGTLVMHLRVPNPDGFSDRLLAAEADALVAISRAVARRFTRFPGSVRDKLHVIPNGVDASRFIPASAAQRTSLRQRFGLPADAPLAVLLAGFDPMKRHDFLLDIWREVHDRSGMQLAFAGSDPEDQRERLRARIEQEGLAHCARILDFVERPQDLLAASDLALIPSEYEGFGRVAIEAGACGVATVARDLPALREILVDGETGRLLPGEAPGEWIDTLSELGRDAERRARMGRAARERVREHFTEERTARSVMALYDRLADR